MIMDERINVFVRLGRFLNALKEEEFQSLAERVKIENPWFTGENLRMAVSAIGNFLEEKKITVWLSSYTSPERNSKRIALIMAGNIPLVGFHDLLCVLINGDAALIKLSSKDTVGIKWLTDKIIEFDARFSNKIIYVDRLKDFDAVIATGSDNSARYFEYYFGKYPHIIRKNRTSVAILEGTETEKEMTQLGTDVFSYFGLGCRNVSKLLVPSGYKFDALFRSWEPFKNAIHHHKYGNNYDYQKSILLVTQTPFLDNGFIMIQESQRWVSPIAVVYFEYYNRREEVDTKLYALRDKLQCIVGKAAPATINFGQTQCPDLGDYADQVDTMKFLNSLGNR